MNKKAKNAQNSRAQPPRGGCPCDNLTRWNRRGHVGARDSVNPGDGIVKDDVHQLRKRSCPLTTIVSMGQPSPFRKLICGNRIRSFLNGTAKRFSRGRLPVPGNLAHRICPIAWVRKMKRGHVHGSIRLDGAWEPEFHGGVSGGKREDGRKDAFYTISLLSKIAFEFF